MAILKCKMCGGDLIIQDGMTVAECEYCGTKQTVPTADNEKKMTLFARANRLRAACEFDKAAGIYESIVAEFPEEAEAFWGLLLCKYGIEYVDDPATGKKIPTCHRSSFDSIMDDDDFEQVMENADPIARRVYREEAKAIEDIRKGIIEVSSKEEPYDIFICYKETDESGNRTIDSVIAQDIYKALTDEGYRVFFARISLEDKLGTAYEPYIFAALNSAKVMLAVGTDYEYYNAVWVKNEWSRFFALIAKGEKKTLIPCYKDIDAYDIPREFKHLQAQDMGKVGAMQDLLRGIGKILGVKSPPAVTHSHGVNAESETMKQRGYMALEDGEIEEAKRFFERALDINPSDGRAYLGKFLAQYGLASLADFDNKVIYQPENNKQFKRAEQFADSTLADELRSFKKTNEIKVERLRLLDALKKTVGIETDYTEACALQESGEEKKLAQAAKIFRKLNYYKDSSKREIACKKAYEEKKADNEQERAATIKRIASIRAKITPCRNLIAAGLSHTVGVKENGTVVAVGNNKNIAKSEVYSDIKEIVIIDHRSVCLTTNGTVLAYGSINDYGQDNVYDWKDIVSVAASLTHTVGLKSDGTVVAVGKNFYGQCCVSTWEEIVAVAAESGYTVGLRVDGTVETTGFNQFAGGDYGQCKEVRDWKDIVDIATGFGFIVGLKKDGTVVATRQMRSANNWKDIVSISASGSCVVGIKSDGTVVSTGYDNNSKRNISDWRDIVAVSVGSYHIVGLKSDGTVIAVGDNKNGQCNVSDWKLFRTDAEKEAEYNTACSLEKENTEDKVSQAICIFRELKNYKDSADRANACEGRLVEIQEISQKESAYTAACRWQESETIGDLEKAIWNFKNLENYKDSVDRARTCSIVLLNSQKNTLQTELSNLKGIFSGKRRKQIEARLAEIDNGLKKM